MEEKYKRIWELALPYLKKGRMKDFVVHTQGVVRAMEMLVEKEDKDRDLLISAAILHDTGWSKVPVDLQLTDDENKKIEGLKLHLKYAVPIIEKILTKVGYDKEQIKEISNLVVAHKFTDPKDRNKRLLIDADALADAFKKQFYADVEAYKTTPEKLYKFRKDNKFYTKTAKLIFDRELENRKEEFKSK